MNIIDLIIKHFDKIVGAILVGAFGGYIAYRNSQKNRFADASIKFRSELVVVLENIYPTISIHTPINDINTKILQSIPKVVTAANIFRGHLPFYSKRSFNRAIKEYDKTARSTDWEGQIAHQMFPDMKKVGNLSPKEKFIHAVENLLKYAKEK